ncbi:uncharacterized protein LOC105768671 [Gossypium raimondii]|uniref:Uncharacterized protein n=2 Tax=Gossypium raimondii TaxID=29730 RepID=A0A0D2TJI1_GOSRA|nr:uncharacterized protein LOC105768671 [Gossypium raimondii]KJB54716.1 hypothetical protein B456_009G046200 [Gossypium raimondii]
MNVQASRTHQEGIYINRVRYILGSQFALSQPPSTYRKKNYSFVSSSQLMALTFKLAQLQSKATRASQLVSKHAPLYYKQLLEQNKHYIQDPPTVEKCNLLSNIPSRYEAFQKEMDYVKLMWKKRNEWKIEDAGIATLFGLECFAWYCTGEIVGRGFTFTGYYI